MVDFDFTPAPDVEIDDEPNADDIVPAKQEKQEVDVKFTLTSVCEHDGATTFKLDVVSVTRKGASKEESTADADDDELTKHSLFVTQSNADGSLSEIGSPELESAAAADFKRGLLSMVNFPAAPEVLSGSLSADLQYEFESVDMHGPHTAKHTAHKHADGITLLATRAYHAGAAEVPDLEAEAEADFASPSPRTTQTGTTKTELAPGGETKDVESKEEITLPGPNEHEGVEGDYTEELANTGAVDVKIQFDFKLAGTAAAKPECSAKAQADPTAYLQTVAGPGSRFIALSATPRAARKRELEPFTAADLAAASALLKANADFTSETFRLASLISKKKGGAKAVAKMGLAHFAETKDAEAFEKLAAALASSGQPEGHSLAAAMAADEQHNPALRVKALVALLTNRKADESILRTVEALANGAYTANDDSAIPGDDDVPAAARLVLGGLLHAHRRAPSTYAAGLLATMESALVSGDLVPAQRVAYVSSLGNAAADSSAAVIAPLAADSQPREVRLAALHALRRMHFGGDVEAAVVAAARCNDTTVSGEATAFLQETGNVVALEEDLQEGAAEGAQKSWKRHAPVGAVEANEVKVTFIQAVQTLSQSDMHYVKLTEGLYYKYVRKGAEITHKVEGSAMLSAGVFSLTWEFLKVGIYAEKVTNKQSGIYFFVDISGFNVIKKSMEGKKKDTKSLADVEEGSSTSLAANDLDTLLEESEAGAVCGDSWSAGIAGDFGYTKQLFKLSKSFWVYIVTLDVEFWATGRVGIKPGISVRGCRNPRTNQDESMVMGGMEPYSSVTLNLEASINLWLIRGGVGGELKIIDIGFPLYGEKFMATGDLCGYLDFKYQACSGRIYLFADYKNFFWRGWSIGSEWKRFGELNLVTWTGFKGVKNILKQCNLGGNGVFGISNPVLLSKHKPSWQSSTGWGGYAHRAVDGSTSGNYGARSCTHTHNDHMAWWVVSLNAIRKIDSVELFNRADCCGNRLANFKIYVSDHSSFHGQKLCASKSGAIGQGRSEKFSCGAGITGRYVKVQLNGRGYLTICEAKVFGEAA